MDKVKRFFIKTGGFFRKVGLWFKNHAPTRRRIIQLYAALLTNANIKGFVSGRIYTGATKNACVPGLNCYSCPGAVGACPLGALQDSLAQSDTRTPYYILGILALFGLALGRTICGFLCPMGLGQELLYKIKTPKVKKSRYTRLLSYLKYVLLVVLVIGIPLLYNGIPAFCKYICPAGTFEGAVALLANSNNASYFDMLGYLFSWKFILLVCFVVLCIFFYRFFCRFICPLGAIYGFFNKVALLGVKLDRDKCVDCGLCLETCRMDIKHVGDHECINCGECIPACPTKAISWKGSKIFVRGTSVSEEAQEELKPLAALVSGGTTMQGNVGGGNAQVNVVLPEGTAKSDTEDERREAEAKIALHKFSRRAFWLELAAWVLAAAVLITALVYYNFFDTSGAVSSYVYNVGEQIESPEDFEFTRVYETAGAYDDEGNRIESFTLADMLGKVTVLNFWYTTCDPCKAELPYFEEVKEEYGAEVNMIVVHSDNGTTKTQVEDAIAELGYSDWQMIFTHDNGIFEAIGGTDVFPVTAVLDSEGYLTFVKQGGVEKDELVSAIEKAK